MKLLRIYKENKALIKQNTELKTKLKSEEEQNMKWITKYSLLSEKYTEGQMEIVNLQSELREERIRNIEITEEKIELLKEFYNKLNQALKEDDKKITKVEIKL